MPLIGHAEVPDFTAGLPDHVAMSGSSRWFPDQQKPEQRFEPGWSLAEDARWDAEEYEDGVDLVSVRLHAPRALHLEFSLGGRDSRLIEFTDVADLQVDGDFALGLTDVGWEVMGTSMLVATRSREDGLRVYFLELSNAMLCFAGLPGA